MSTSCVDTGDTTWVLIATILVLGMMPALAFFEAGLLRKRSVLSILSQIFLGIMVMGFIWFLFGFSLVFGGDHGGIIGDFRHSLFLNMTKDSNEAYCLPQAPRVPAMAYAMFQQQFASITPLLMTGAFSERIRISGFLIIIVAFEVLVYIPVAHSIWGGGLLSRLGVIDFAGGIVIHATAGAGSVCAAIVLGRRHKFDDFGGEFPPHNVSLAAIGAALLFMGWFGFNAGSALAAGALAASTVAVSAVTASTCGICFLVLSLWVHRKFSTVALLNGFIIGLAGITPASGFVEPWAGLPIGLMLAITSHFGIVVLRNKFRIDDALDVGSVHGLPGFFGAWLGIGLFASPHINHATGLVYGSGRLLWVQLVGLLVVIVWTALVTLPLVYLLKRFHWFSLHRSSHAEGLDFHDHLEGTAYAQDYFSGMEDEAESLESHSKGRLRIEGLLN